MQLKFFGMITESVNNACGCLPGILYGLPKAHELGVTDRPFFAACNTPL